MRHTFFTIKLIFILFLLLNCHYSVGQNIDSLERIINGNAPDTAKFDAYNQLFDVFFDNDIDKSLRYAEEYLSYSKKIENDLNTAVAYKLLGETYSQKDFDLETIETAYENALLFAKKAENPRLQAVTSNGLALVYERFAQKEKALALYQQAFTILDEMGRKSIAVRVLGNIAAFLKDDNDFTKAKYYYFKAIDYAKNINDEVMVSQLGNNLANIYVTENKLDSAKILYEKAIETNRKADDKYFTSLALSSLGHVYTKEQKFELAQTYLTEGYQLAIGIQDKRCISVALMYLADNHSEQGQYSKAIQTANEGIQILGKNGDIQKRMSLHGILSTNYEATGNFQAALESQRIFQTFSDSLYNTNKAKQINDLQIKYEVSKKESQNKLLKAEKEIAQKTLRSRTAIAFGVIALLLLVGGYSFFIHRSNQQRKKLNQELEQKVDERTQALQTANKNLEQANYELRTFNYIASHDIKEPIRNVGNYAGLIFRKLPENLQHSLGSYFDIIKNSTNQLYTLVEDFSRYSIMSRDEAIEREPVDLNVLVNSLEHALYESIQKSNGRILNKGLPTIMSNKSLLYSMLKNLTGNGLKYNKSTVPTVELSYGETETHHKIIVTDNGIGIEKEYQEQVFDMFKRLHNRSEYEGSGIGLAIVKLGTNKLNGNVQLESEVGKGSQFILSLPK